MNRSSTRERDPDSPQSPQPQKRTRSAVACIRCKERRQKCDNAEPACSNCTKAGKQCVFSGSEYPTWYIRSLEEHIAKLESRLSEFESSHADDHLHHSDHLNGMVDNEFRQASPVPAPGSTSSPPNHLGTSLGFLSLLAAGEQYYQGMSGGYSLGHLVQSALYETGSKQDHLAQSTQQPSPVVSVQSPLDLPGPDQRPFSCHVPRTDTPPASLPSPELGHLLLSAYLSAVHRSYPFMDRSYLIQSHLETRRTPHSKPITQRQKMTRLKLHLVYGIGARHLQLSSSENPGFARDLPESHYIAAVAILGDAFELRGTANVEALLLLGFYSLHASSGPGVWQLCGIALRLCVGMRLHRKVVNLPVGMEKQDQLRKRLFWSCYMLERRMSNTLGRPYSLADDDIDVEYPVNEQPEEFTGHDFISLPETDVHQHIHLVRLERIISQIQKANAKITLAHPPSLQALYDLRNQLDHWRKEAMANHYSESLNLSFHKASLTLLQPFILRPNPDFQIVVDCTQVSGQICQSYKRLHQGEDTGLFLQEIHDILVAGIALVYCAWLNPKAVNPFVVSSDLGACSTVLFLVSTRRKSAKKFRDAFEAIMAKAMDHISKSNQTGSFEPVLQEKVDIQPEHLDTLGQGQWLGEDDILRMLNDMTGMTSTTNGSNTDVMGDFGWLNDYSDVEIMPASFI